MFSTSIITSQL